MYVYRLIYTFCFFTNLDFTEERRPLKTDSFYVEVMALTFVYPSENIAQGAPYLAFHTNKKNSGNLAKNS